MEREEHWISFGYLSVAGIAGISFYIMRKNKVHFLSHSERILPRTGRFDQEIHQSDLIKVTDVKRDGPKEVREGPLATRSATSCRDVNKRGLDEPSANDLKPSQVDPRFANIGVAA